MATSLTSATYSPINSAENHRHISHQHNISESSSFSSSINEGSLSSSKRELQVEESLVAPFSPETFVEETWSGRSKSSLEKKPEKVQEREVHDVEAQSGPSKDAQGPSHGSWRIEIISMFTSVAALAAIIGVLSHFDGHALPDWPRTITLNTLIALLTAIANASMVAPLSSGLSQLKWLHFHGKRRRLTDIELFDDASRGVYGSIRLLICGRGGVLGSLGAGIVLVALALGPFAQQVVVYRTRSVASTAPAAIMTASNYTVFLPGNSNNSDSFVPILPMKAAVYNGMFSASDPSKALAVDCSTGNCTWSPYETLAVCASCVSMGQYLSRSCGEGENAHCSWKLPSGASLDGNTSVFGMTTEIPDSSGSMPYTEIMRLTFMGTEAQNATAHSTSDRSAPWATQCSLQYCVQQLNSTVQNGVLTENVTATYTNATVLDIRPNLEAGNPVPALITTGSNTTYTVGMGSILGIQQWFASIFRNATASRSASSSSNQKLSNNPSSNIVVNLTVGVSSGETYFDTDMVQAFYWYYYEYPSGLAMLTTSLAQAMTNHFRSSGGAVPVAGVTRTLQSYVGIRWAWITLPVVTVASTAVFLVAAIVTSKRRRIEVWKSNALATLFQGGALDGEVKSRWRHGGMSALRGLYVQLEGESEKGGGERGLVTA